MTNLLLPADACPRCPAVARITLAHPYRLNVQGAGDGIFAFYRCPLCRYSWRTGWALDAMTLPCPGCDACTPSAGAA
jgi:hypothetical protein